MSDNGSFRLGREGIDIGSNAPLRNGGVTCWEGGIRVAAFARYPGKIPAGVVIDEPLWSPDLMTACRVLAQMPQVNRVSLDGANPLPVLYGNGKSSSRSFYFDYKNHSALRWGQWKIVRELPTKPWQLYDLSSDLGEERNLAATLPGKVRELVAARAAWRQSF